MDQKQAGSGKKRGSKKNNAQEQAHIASLLELQDFLSTELIEQGTAYRRAFVPLTDGLGLESPRQLTPKIELQEIETAPVETHIEPAPQTLIEEKIPPVTEPPKTQPFKISVTSLRNTTRLAEVMESPSVSPAADFFESKIELPKFEIEQSLQTQPPPLPRPSMFKRLLAGIIDQVFVLFIWTGMIVLTSNLINDFTTGFSVEIITDFAQPKFQRIAILEFAAAWLGYLGFALLLFKRTFGMWVWSLGLSYGDSVEENYTLRKGMRIFWTFIFSAPVIPSVLLIIRKNGRNILDILSGTNVYDAD